MGLHQAAERNRMMATISNRKAPVMAGTMGLHESQRQFQTSLKSTMGPGHYNDSTNSAR